MRIRELSLNHVGPFEDATLDFGEQDGDGELVLFEGPNGCGKTTIADAIARLVGTPGESDSEQRPLTGAPYASFVPRFREPRDQRIAYVGILEHGDERVRIRGRYGNPWLDRDGSAAIRASLDDYNAPEPKPLHWAAFVYHSHMPSAKLASDGPREIAEDPRSSALAFDKTWTAAEALGQLAVNLEFERIQFAQYATERKGEGTDLSDGASARKKTIQMMENAFSRLLGREVRLVFELGKMAPKMLFDGADVPLDQLGEGMRSSIAWLSDLLVRLIRIPWFDLARSPFEQEFWLILDEVEASLHPTAQLRVLPTLRELFPRARIYATTHSPFVVASASDGRIFCLRPDPVTHLVSGTLQPVPLTPGQSLEWVVSSIFDTPIGIVDTETRAAIEAHQRDIHELRAGREIDWAKLLERRKRLVALNDEVATIVLVTEAPIRKVMEEKVRSQAA